MAKRNRASVLIIYTGGTIGMIHDADTGALRPFSFDQILVKMPELMQFNYDLSAVAFQPPIDSSDVTPELWVRLVNLIGEEYDHYDGFVILHGTDTMAYSASALSFMLINLGKPVIFTGSQLPIGAIRTDGKENLINAIEIAAAKQNQLPVVPEVCIFFENKLLRGNRTTKFNVEHFNAFMSNNYPLLAETGVHIKFNHHLIRKTSNEDFQIKSALCDQIATIRLFPGIRQEVVEQIINTKGLKALIIETFGAGNTMSELWFAELLKQATQKGMILLNISQCLKGSVEMGVYKSSEILKNSGVISGGDITMEAAITKLMFLLGNYTDPEEIKLLLTTNLAGELTK